MGRLKLEGYMVSNPDHSRISIEIIELLFCTVIVLMVMHIINCNNYEILYIVPTNYIQCLIIEMDAIATTEKHLEI